MFRFGTAHKVERCLEITKAALEVAGMGKVASVLQAANSHGARQLEEAASLAILAIRRQAGTGNTRAEAACQALLELIEVSVATDAAA